MKSQGHSNKWGKNGSENNERIEEYVGLDLIQYNKLTKETK